MTAAAIRRREAYWGPDLAALEDEDPEIADVVLGELRRERETLQLIASENFTSPAVLAATGSTLTNKYADGYPEHRYYRGCEQVDRAEAIAVRRATRLFGADHANVQPHSGTSAVLATFAALMAPGDTVLAMAPAHGGHFTQGSPANFSGRWFRAVGYGVRRDDERIDYDQVRVLAHRHHPTVIMCGAAAYPRLIDFAAFRAIADEVNAYLVVDAAHLIGLVAGGVSPSPMPYADVVCASTHKVLRGPRGGLILCRAELADLVDRAVFPFTQGGPLMHTVAAKAVALGEASGREFHRYVRRVVANARTLAEALAAEGMRPVSGGTDTHLVLLDLRPLSRRHHEALTGDVAEERCERARLVLNRAVVAHDPRGPLVASGIRVGTSAVTTQGMGVSQMREVGALLGRAVRDEDGTAADEIAREVAALAAAYPPYRGPRPSSGDHSPENHEGEG